MQLSDRSFRQRVHSDPRLYAITSMMRSQLHEGYVTVEDVVRCAVLASEMYLEEHNVPMNIRIEHGERNSPLSACECYSCLNKPELGMANPTFSRMVVCPKCGNKRCPKATHHDNACTGSNASGQKGSRYE